jgi:Ca2+-binding EF-hand superfamily protein
VVREEFGMTIKIDKLLDELDKDKDGKVSYSEFATLFA